MQKGQLIHESVLDGMPATYEPKARIYDNEIAWDKAILKSWKMIESDPYGQADDVLSRLEHDWATSASEVPDADIDVLYALASNGEFFVMWCARL